MRIMMNLRRFALIFGLVLVWPLACGKDEIPEPDINETLQGNGRWECETQTEDDEGNKIEFSATLRFTAPTNYRLFYFTIINLEEDPDSRHDEHGIYEVILNDTPNAGSVSSGTLNFTPEEGDPWSTEFNILDGSGFLAVIVPDVGLLEFDFFRYGWG